MRTNWKRILAAVLAAGMIFCDSSLVYGGESKPAVEVTEDATTEEPQEEEQQVPVDENVVVEIPEVVEKKEATVVETTTNPILELNVPVVATVTETTEVYSETFDFTATADGGHFIYTDNSNAEFTISGILVYKEDGKTTINGSRPESCYDFEKTATNAADVIEGFIFKEGTKYRITVMGNFKSGTSSEFYIGKYENDPIQLMSGESVTVPANSKVVYKVCEETTQSGIIEYTFSGDTYEKARAYAPGLKKWDMGSGFMSPSEQKGYMPLIVLGGLENYIAIVTEDKEETICWTTVEAQALNLGDEATLSTDKIIEYKFFVFTPDENVDYILSDSNKRCHNASLLSDRRFMHLGKEYLGKEGKCKYYGQDYTDSNGVYWRRYQYLEGVEQVWIIAQVQSDSYTLALKEYQPDAVSQVLTCDSIVEIPGISNEYSYDFWHEFTPQETLYYMLDSAHLNIDEIGIWNETTQSYDETETEYFYKLKSGGTEVSDTVKCIKLNANMTYGIRIKGTVPTSGTTFQWTTIDQSEAPAKLTLGSDLNVGGNSSKLYELSSEKTVLGILTFSDYALGKIGFLGDVDAAFYYETGTKYDSGFKRTYAVIIPEGKKGYTAVNTGSPGATLEWKDANATILEDGYDEVISATEDILKCYEFTPKAAAKYQLLAQGDQTYISILGKDGFYKELGIESDDEAGNTWIEYSDLENIDKVYILVKVNKNSTGRVAFKELVSAVDETQINHTLTENQLVAVYGGETGKSLREGYTFKPEISGYYNLESETFRDSSYAIYDDSTGAYNYSPNLQLKCVLKENASSVTDVITSHYFEAGKTYIVYITGSVAADTTKTFVWKKCNLTDTATEISLNNEEVSVPTGKVSIFKFCAKETNAVNVEGTGTYYVNVYADSYGGVSYGTTVDEIPNFKRTMPVGKGKTYYFVLYAENGGTISISKAETTILEPGASLTAEVPEGQNNAILCYECIPEAGTTYQISHETDNKSLDIMGKDGNRNWVAEGTITDSDGNVWTEIKATDDYEKIYLILMVSKGNPKVVALKSDNQTPVEKNITILDYDYYDTFVHTATGGSISVENGKVTITPKSGGAKLVAQICSILGTAEDFVEETWKDIKAGNVYWKGFAPKKIYRLNDGDLQDVDVEDVKAGDVLVVKYEPEVVWVHSMTVKPEKTVMNIDDEAQIHITAKAATTKYPLENPIFTYVSSNPEIVSVDKSGKMTAHSDGKVKITVLADVAKRHEEGCSNKILKKEFYVTVSQRFNIHYKNISNGNEVFGSLNATTLEVYNTLETTSLGKPDAEEGYDFVGWYTDSALRKAATKIAKGSTGDKTFYAKWKLHDYKIKYELGDGKFAADANQPITFTMAEKTMLTDPIRMGYALDYWYWMVDDGTGKMKGEKLPCQDGHYYLPENLKNDVEIFAKWKFDTTFSLTINADKENGDSLKYIITHPYNSVTGEWEYLNSSFAIQADKEGVFAELDANQNGDPSVVVELWKSNEKVATWKSTDERYIDHKHYRVTEILSKDIQETGDYCLKVSYTHPGEETQEIEQNFTVVYAKREYPVNKEVNWSKLSNIDSGLRFGFIKDEIANKMLADVKADAPNLEKVILKNSKNKVVSDTAKVTSGTYIVVLEFEENERFLTEATGTVHISYGTVTNAGVEYQAIEEEEAKDDRIIGNTIAFKVSEVGNTTPYTTGVELIPMLKLPWSEEPVRGDHLEAELEEQGDKDYKVAVEVKESSRSPILAIVNAEDNASVYISSKDNIAGKTTLVVDTIISREGLETPIKVSTTIKNFTVVSGGTDAVKTITLNLHNSEQLTEETIVAERSTDEATGAKTYWLEKNDKEARTYWVDVKAFNYEGDEAENVKLSWKTSNSKIAAAKAAKDGTVTLNIPKNAQGVADITVTANDAAKNSQSMKFVIVDTSMRLDTANVTINSKMTEHDAVLDLYPNVLASELSGGKELEDFFNEQIEEEDKIAIYQKVGKVYQKSEVFECAYDYTLGKLIVSIAEGKYPAKAATYSLFVGVLHAGDVVIAEDGSKTIAPSELHPFKLKDTCALPKAPSLKVTKNYEAVYKKGWAELTLTLKALAAVDENGNPIMIQTKDKTLFEVVEWKDVKGDGTTWNLKLRANSDSVMPTAKQKSKVTKNVEFLVAYEGYRIEDDAKATVKTNITVTNAAPKLYVYGDDAYAPTYYTDANLRSVDVVIPVTEEFVDGIADGKNSYGLTINKDSSGAVIGDDLSETKELSVTLTDPGKFEVYSAEVHSNHGTIPAKKGEKDVDYAIYLTVRVRENQSKNVNLQFAVTSSGLEEGVSVKTQSLTVKPAKVSSEAIRLTEKSTSKTVKNLVFNSNYAGKESAEIQVGMPAKLTTLSESNRYSAEMIVEAADKNTQKMLQNNELLLEVDNSNHSFKVTPVAASFKYTSAKLKIMLQVSGINTKSTTLTMNLKKTATPKITISNAKLIRGLKANLEGSQIADYSNGKCTTKVSYANLPAGAEITNVRFADQADYAKYYDPEFGESNTQLIITAKPQSNLSLGKDTIGMIFDVRTVSGEIIPVSSTFNLTIADSFGLKANVKSMNLYNSAVGKAYGKEITFSDAKGHAAEVIEIVNEAELHKAGIDVEFQDSLKEHTLKFYVSDQLKRGIEKTYTVKAKVAVVNSAVKNTNGTWTKTYAGEKVLTFKVVLKK